MTLAAVLVFVGGTASTSLSCIAVGPTGHTVAVGCSDGNVHLVDASTRETLATFWAGEGSIARLAWSRDASRLCAEVKRTEAGDAPADAENESVRSRPRWIVWEVARGKVLFDESDATESLHEPLTVLSPDGSRLVTRGSDPEASLWDLDHRRLIAPLDRQVRMTTAVWSTDGKSVFTGDESGQLCSWDAKAGFLRAVTSPGSGPISALAVTSDGAHVLSACTAPVSVACLRTVDLHLEWQREIRFGWSAEDRVTDLAISPDSSRIVAATGPTAMAESFDVRDGRHVMLLGEDPFSQTWLSAAFDPTGDRIAMWGRSFSARLLDASGGSNVASISSLGVRGGRGSLAWTSDGRYLVARCKELVVLDAKSFEVATTWSPDAR